MKNSCLFAMLILLSSCSGNKTAPNATGTAALNPAPDYTPRLGVAVSTGSRTCMAIQNANLAASTPVTLVEPMPPQSAVQVEIGTASTNPCPVSKEVDATVSNYDLRVPSGSNLPKLTPLIAVTGTSAPFTTAANGNMQADLDQNGKFETFRACTENDGIHLTVWAGNALDGTVLWRGYYYEPGNPGVGPACTPKEIAAQ